MTPTEALAYFDSLDPVDIENQDYRNPDLISARS